MIPIGTFKMLLKFLNRVLKAFTEKVNLQIAGIVLRFHDHSMFKHMGDKQVRSHEVVRTDNTF